jgi:predicted acetyltransferase
MLLRPGDPRRRSRATELLSHALELADTAQLRTIAVTCRNLAKHHAVSLAEPASTGERSG